MQRKLHIIVNPASGASYTILHTLNNIFSKYEIDWELSFTKQGNIHNFAKYVAESDADLVMVYGGDGTIAEIPSSLIYSDKISGILPGGCCLQFIFVNKSYPHYKPMI